jgi:hypothetical protein
MTEYFTQHTSSIKTVRPEDSGFMLQDSLMICPRAGFEISINCPQKYMMMIETCLNNGWLKPVAHMYDHELVWDQLSK